jgi:hypothetical protein
MNVYIIFALITALIMSGWLLLRYIRMPHYELFTNSTPMAPIVLTMYKTEWCGYSQKAKPMIQGYTSWMESGKGSPKVAVEIVDCDSAEGKPRCASANIQGYPSYHLSVSGKAPVPVELGSEMTPEEVHRTLGF